MQLFLLSSDNEKPLGLNVLCFLKQGWMKKQSLLCDITFTADCRDMTMLWLHHRSNPLPLCFSHFWGHVIINKCCLMRRDMKGWQHLWTTLPHILRLNVSPNQKNSLHKRESQNLKEEEEEEQEEEEEWSHRNSVKEAQGVPLSGF